jgi:Domain of unknown function (DUF6532)
MDCLVSLDITCGTWLNNCLLQIFKDGASFRGALKKVAAETVKRSYAKDIDPDTDLESQRDLATLIQRNVEALLENGKFLQDGTDDEVWLRQQLNLSVSDVLKGRTNNLAHPSIFKTCLDFFYSGKNSLAARFPSDFKDSIPDHTIALVITTVCVIRLLLYKTYCSLDQALSRRIFDGLSYDD